MTSDCEYELYTKGGQYQVSELAALRFYPKRDLTAQNLPGEVGFYRPLWEQSLRFAVVREHPIDEEAAQIKRDQLLRVCEIEVAGRVVKFLITNVAFDRKNDIDPFVIKYQGIVHGVGLEDDEVVSANFGLDDLIAE